MYIRDQDQLLEHVIESTVLITGQGGLNSLGWFYNWSPNAANVTKAFGDEHGVEFVPMQVGRSWH